MNQKSLQGCPLQTLNLTDDGVPTFIPVITSFIKQFPSTVGVFRVNGNKSYIDDFYILFNHKQCAVPPCCMVHDVAGFLKNWLMTLPEPILIPSVFNEYFEEDVEPTVDQVLIHLPDINRKILAYLFSCINVIYQNANQNQMNMANISTCFQTCLTQDSTLFKTHVPFRFFFLRAVTLLNETETDFNFTTTE